MAQQCTQNYPALPGLVSGAPDSPGGAVVAATPITAVDINGAERQAKRRKVLAKRGAATMNEVADADVPLFSILSEHAGAAAVPAWAAGIQGAIQGQLNNMQGQLNNIEARFILRR